MSRTYLIPEKYTSEQGLEDFKRDFVFYDNSVYDDYFSTRRVLTEKHNKKMIEIVIECSYVQSMWIEMIDIMATRNLAYVKSLQDGRK